MNEQVPTPGDPNVLIILPTPLFSFSENHGNCKRRNTMMWKKLRQRISRKRLSLRRRKSKQPVVSSPVSVADFDKAFVSSAQPEDPPGTKESSQKLLGYDLEEEVHQDEREESSRNDYSSSCQRNLQDSPSLDDEQPPMSLSLVDSQEQTPTPSSSSATASVIDHDSSTFLFPPNKSHEEEVSPTKRASVTVENGVAMDLEASAPSLDEECKEEILAVEEECHNNKLAEEINPTDMLPLPEEPTEENTYASPPPEDPPEEIKQNNIQVVVDDESDIQVEQHATSTPAEIDELIEDQKSLSFECDQSEHKTFTGTHFASTNKTISPKADEDASDKTSSNHPLDTPNPSPEKLPEMQVIVPAIKTTSAPTLVSEAKNTIAPSSSSRPSGHGNIGKRVLIHAGANKGKQATIIGVKRKGTYEVEFENGNKAGVRFTSVNILDENIPDIEEVREEPSSITRNLEKSQAKYTEVKKELKEVVINDAPSVQDKGENGPTVTTGSRVFVHAGKNKGKSGSFVEFRAGLYKLSLDSGETVRVRPTSVDIFNETELKHEECEAAPMRLPLERQDAKHSSHEGTTGSSTGIANPSLYVGKRVRIHAGKNSGREGLIVQMKNKRTYTIQFQNGETAGVLVSSVRLLEGHETVPTDTTQQHPLPQNTAGVIISSKERETMDRRGLLAPTLDLSSPKNVIVERRQRSDQTAGHSKRPRSERNRTSNIAPVNTSLRNVQPSDSSPTSQNSSTSEGSLIASLFRVRVPGSDDRVLKFGRSRIRKVLLSDSESSKKEEITFMRHLFGEMLLYVDFPLRGQKKKDFEKVLNHEGSQYELVSATIEKDTESSFKFSQVSVAKLVYVNVSRGTAENSISVKDILETLGDFAALNPRKAAVRLELFQSPARFPIKGLKSSSFRFIEEEGNVGCGFISAELLEKICLEQGDMSKSAAKVVSAIQVRLFIPSKGIFKGMLQRKRIKSGYPPIELPPSMQKVLPSKVPDKSDRAAILVCKNGVHPSGKKNEYIGRKLDPSRKPPPPKSFKTEISKKLSEMILNLWESLGVPEHETKKYQKEALEPQRHNHAWIVGVADPTNEIPPDHVYVPGLFDEQPQKVFVTRSPCLKHSDGRLIKTLRSKPTTMSDVNWNELTALPFGSIVFAKPRPGKMSMPERIASGDLDGDLYLVCWDKTILRHMTRVEPMPEMDMEDDGILATGPRNNENWLKDAQDTMVDVNSYTVIGKLTGTLFRLSQKEARESPNFMRDENAIAFADAYNKALEFKKHGNPIYLPLHLHQKLPKGLRQHATADPAS